MDKIVQKINWDIAGSHKIEIYMYGKASVEANQEMQEPLEKLYKYENQPDIRKKVKEYIGTLCAEIDRCNAKVFKSTETESRLNAIIEVMDDLLGILEEKC